MDIERGGKVPRSRQKYPHLQNNPYLKKKDSQKQGRGVRNVPKPVTWFIDNPLCIYPSKYD